MMRASKFKRMMANLLLTVFLSILFHNAEVAFAQYCEAPTIFENGVRKSTQITVHFKEKVFDLPRGVWQAQIGDMASAVANVRQHFSQLEQRYGAVSFVKVIPNAMWGDVWQRHKRTGQLVRIHDMSQLFFVRFAQFVPIDSIIAELEQLPEVEYAHRPIEAISLADPNDPFYQDGSQWNLTKIDAAKAWDITTGSSTVVVGVIEDGQFESGIPNINHQDFGTGPGSTGQSKFEPGKGDTGPSGYHATQVAGIIGAATNDGDGVASLGWNIKMIPYRYTAYATGSQNIAAKIDTARSQGCDVINCSFVTRSPTATKIGGCLLYTTWDYPSVATAIANAISAGIVVVAGTGNTGLELTAGDCSESQISSRIPYRPYPASYPNVIGVSAADGNDIFAGGRNYNWDEGAGFMDVAAPGIDVKTVTNNANNTYAIDSGTSFSSPHVAALAGLIVSLNPLLASSGTGHVTAVGNIINSTAVDVNQSQYPGYDGYMGHGRINAYQALLMTHAYSNKSMSATATAQNNGRRLVRDSSGKYHLVFESGITSGGNVLSEIFYRNSTDGVNWSTPVRLNFGNEQPHLI
ncbi:MAG: S8 family serine peptidase [candidate division KSB1 bacterium]|nr:S8 family serine peptidase [candidate division KSB1 bacterium]